MLEQISHILTLTLSSNVCCIFAHSIDLVPRQNALNWLRYLRHSTPTLPFRSSTSHQRSNLSSSTAPALMRILKAYKPSAAQSVTVGVVGYPNVGKSSLINTLKRSKVCPPPPFFLLKGTYFASCACASDPHTPRSVQWLRSRVIRKIFNTFNSNAACASSTLQVSSSTTMSTTAKETARAASCSGT